MLGVFENPLVVSSASFGTRSFYRRRKEDAAHQDLHFYDSWQIASSHQSVVLTLARAAIAVPGTAKVYFRYVCKNAGKKCVIKKKWRERPLAESSHFYIFKYLL
jgi:hypothetical protein